MSHGRLDFQDVFKEALSYRTRITLDWAALHHKADLDHWIDTNPDEMDNIFSKALHSENVTVLEWLRDKTARQLPALIEKHKQNGFKFAFEKGHERVIQWFAETVPDQFSHLFAQIDLSSLKCLIETGVSFTAMLNILKKYRPDCLDAMLGLIASNDYRLITSDQYEVFQTHLASHVLFLTEVLEWYANSKPNLLPDIFTAATFDDNKYLEFHDNAVTMGYANLLDWLALHYPDQTQAALALDSAKGYFMYSRAAEWGYVEIVARFAQQAGPNQLRLMSGKDNYSSFRTAFGRGKIRMLEWFKQNVPDQWSEMLASLTTKPSNYRCAIKNSQLRALEWYAEEVGKEKEQLQLKTIAFNDQSTRKMLQETVLYHNLGGLVFLLVKHPKTVNTFLALVKSKEINQHTLAFLSNIWDLLNTANVIFQKKTYPALPEEVSLDILKRVPYTPWVQPIGFGVRFFKLKEMGGDRYQFKTFKEFVMEVKSISDANTPALK